MSFNYFISYGGGIGPDVWDAEIQLSAVDIKDAVAQATGAMEECGGWIFMVSQEDYPLSTRQKLEEDCNDLRAQLADAKREQDEWKEHAGLSDTELCLLQDSLGCPYAGDNSPCEKALERIRDLIAAEGEVGDLTTSLASATAERDRLAGLLSQWFTWYSKCKSNYTPEDLYTTTEAALATLPKPKVRE